MIRKFIDRCRLKLADKLMRFCLDRGLNDVRVVVPLYNLYGLLIKGVYVLSHEEAKHHYIPKFLLRKFSIPGTGNIFQYSYTKSPEAVSIKLDAAHEPNLYSFRDKETKQQSDFIEKQMFAHTLEKYASRVINQQLDDPNKDLTVLEASILTSFISFQYTRTPKFFYSVKHIIEYLHLAKGIQLEEMLEFDFYQKAFFENFYEIKPQEVGAFQLKNDLNLIGAVNLILRLAMSIGNRLSEIVYQKSSYSFRAAEPAFFYLSDSPVGIFNVNKDRHVGPFLWEINDYTIIYLPISPSMCFCYLPREVDLPAPAVGQLVQYATGNGIFQYAYSDRNDCEIDKLFGTQFRTSGSGSKK